MSINIFEKLKEFVLSKKYERFNVYELPFNIPRKHIGLVSMWLSKWYNEGLIDRTSNWVYYKFNTLNPLWVIIIRENDGTTYTYLNNTTFKSIESAKNEVRRLKERENKLPEIYRKRISFNIKRIK